MSTSHRTALNVLIWSTSIALACSGSTRTTAVPVQPAAVPNVSSSPSEPARNDSVPNPSSERGDRESSPPPAATIELPADDSPAPLRLECGPPGGAAFVLYEIQRVVPSSHLPAEQTSAAQHLRGERRFEMGVREYARGHFTAAATAFLDAARLFRQQAGSPFEETFRSDRRSAYLNAAYSFVSARTPAEGRRQLAGEISSDAELASYLAELRDRLPEACGR